MGPADRYDSLFTCYAAWRRHKGTLVWEPRVPPLDWQSLKRQALVESHLDPDAISPVGAQGLTQFMTATFAEWVKSEFMDTPPPRYHVSIFDPEDAIWAQADVMAWLLAQFGGDLRKALAAYNAGIGTVSRLVKTRGDSWEAGLPKETQGYLEKNLRAP